MTYVDLGPAAGEESRRATALDAGPEATCSVSNDHSAPAGRPHWTFLTNHAHVLLCVARQPEIRVRDMAQIVGVTERCVQRILSDLEEAGYVSRVHQGRRNYYVVHSELPLRHPVEQNHQVSVLLSLVPGNSSHDREEEL